MSWTTRKTTALALTGALMLPASSCGPVPNRAAVLRQEDGLDAFLRLAKFNDVVDQDGRPVDVQAIRQAVKDKHVTVAFGFEGCGVFCPVINPVLARFGARMGQDNTVHIAINTEGAGVAYSQQSRDAFLRQLRAAGIKQNIVTLYPKTPEVADQLQVDMGETIRRGTVKDAKGDRTRFAHSDRIILFGKDGRHLGTVSTLQPGINPVAELTQLAQGPISRAP